MIVKHKIETVPLGKHIRLRELAHRDSEKIVEWRNDDNLTRHFIKTGVLTVEKQNAFVDVYLQRPDDYYFVAELLESKRPVGTVAIYNIDMSDKSAEYGRLIIEEQSRLFSVEIAYLALAFAFEQLGMKTLYGHVKDTNIAALKFDQAIGFTIERHLDDEVFKGQHYQNFTRVTMDTAAFAQLKERWANRVLAG